MLPYYVNYLQFNNEDFQSLSKLNMHNVFEPLKHPASFQH